MEVGGGKGLVEVERRGTRDGLKRGAFAHSSKYRVVKVHSNSGPSMQGRAR